jgi:hypothetical protein
MLRIEAALLQAERSKAGAATTRAKARAWRTRRDLFPRHQRRVSTRGRARPAANDHRSDPHGITGTVDIAFCGEPSTSLSLIAR